MRTHLFILFLFTTFIGTTQYSSESIPTYTIDWLLHENKIWQLTDAGVYIRDEITLNIIDHFYIQEKGELYAKIVKDKLDNIWITTNKGVGKFDGKNWTIWDYHNTPIFQKDFAMRSMGIESDGTVWVTSHHNTTSEPARVYYYKNNSWTEDFSGLLVSTSGDIDFVLDRNNNFIAIVEDTILTLENDHWIGVPELQEKMYDFYNNPCIDSQGNLWLCTSGNNIIKYHSLKEKPILITQSPGAVYHMLFDNDDNLWITTENYEVSIWKNQNWKSVPSLAGTSMLGYPWLLLSGKAHRMYVHQAIHAYECIVTIFENEQPISNHYIDYALDQELGIDSKGNLWFGGSSNAFSRKNIADGSFDYFELFQFPLSEFQYGLERKLISGQGEEMFYITHFGKLLHFNGNSWNEIKKNGISLNIKDAAISDSNLLYTISEQDYGKKIDVFNFKTGIWSEIDLSVHGFLRIEAIKKGTNDIIWFSTLQSLGKINQDATVDVFDIPGIYFVEYGSIGFDVSSSGMVQLLGSGNTSSMFVFNPNSEIWSKYDIPDQVLTELDKYESYFKLDHNDNIWIAYTVDQIFGNRTLKVWNFAGGIWNEIVNEQNSNFIYLTGMNELHDGSIVILLQNEIITIGPGGLISGKTLVDKNQNCLYDSVDIGFPELIVSAKNSNGHSNFRYSNKDGHYSIYNTSGKILVNAIPPNPYWISCNPNGVELDLKKDSSVNLDILLDELISCPSIETQISSTSLRQCREATLSINVVNNGTLSADSTFIIVTLPTKLTVLNSSITYDDLGNQRFRFYLGRLNIFESRAFKIKVQVSCDVVLGQSLCIEVSTFPDVLCSVDPLWNGADIRLTATCKNDNASFELYNKGIVATSSPLKYTIFKNDIKLTEANYTLASGEKLNVNIPSDGGTYRLSSNQEKYHPAEKEGLSLAVEGCPELTGPIFTRYVESHRNFLGSPNELIFCFPVTGAYDPNDKIASPVGVGNNTHFIEKDEEIQYTIRFQNTGTDTAFDVKIIDTLNRNLDLSTLKIVQSSHPVSVELNDYVLVLRFSNVYLPDSNIDLTASNGFVKYKITPRANAPLGSFISNKASIYFDFNAAVTTNEVWHIIRPGNDVTSTIDNYKHNDNPAVLVIYPNPTNSGITIDTKAFNDFTLNVYDINGKKSGSRFVSGNFNKIELNLEHYQTGLYFISILNKDGKKYYGKVVKQ